jgi:hypothetical protein
MSSSPKVSIVIPVYNGANYLRTAIDSALAQTYDNVEVLVINDGSNDEGKTDAIAQAYGDRIRYYRKENGGVSSALNLGLSRMTGDYFAWLSHDDAFSENRIEEDIKLLEKTPDAKITFCRKRMIDESGSVIDEPEYPIKEVKNPRDALVLGGVDFCAMTVHRSCFDVVGFFNENSRTMQDVEMTLRLSRKFNFYHNEKAYVLKRQHAEMGTNTMRAARRADNKALMEFIHTNFSVDDFFTDVSSRGEAQHPDAWERMGDIYTSFQSFEYADECYAKSTEESGIILSRAGLKRLLGARVVYVLSYVKRLTNAVPDASGTR